MKLTTTARHFEMSPELNEYTRSKLIKLRRFFDHILHVDVTMSIEKFRNMVEVNVHVNGHDFSAKEESDDMRISIDKAAKHLERQMKRFKGKIVANHQKHKKILTGMLSAEAVIKSGSVGAGSGLEIIEQVPRDIPDCSPEEAIIKMEDRQDIFLLFNNNDSGKLNIVYKRPDGNYGLIDMRG